MSADTYVTLTPYGRVDAEFGDGPGVAMRGPEDAIAHVVRTMSAVTGSGGLTMTVDSVDEFEFFHFCQPEDSGIRILAPASMLFMDAANADEETEGDADDFDPEAEFGATPEDDDEAKLDGLMLDGDFPGHPFRGNQYRKASRESGAAVGASIKAKRAEGKGDHKASRSAHKAAHHAHMAAAEGATGKARHYHRTMARFHGKRAGARLDSATDTAESEPVTVNSFKSGDKVVSLDNNSDYTVTGQRGAMVSLKGEARAVHANRLKLASGAKPPRVKLDAVDHDWHRRTQEKFRDYTDEQLRFVIKDAREAEELGRKMNPNNPRLGRYADEVNYASMELARRKKGGKKGDKLDAVEDLPGLRLALKQAKGAKRKLRIARSLLAWQPGSELVGVERATDEARKLLILSKTGDGKACAAAEAIERAIEAQDFDGVSIRWDAITASEAPAFDAVESGGLFGADEVGTDKSYLRGDVAYKGRTFASIYVRGDGSAALVPSDRMSGLAHWESQVENAAELVAGWVNGVASADDIAEAVAGPRGMGADVGSLAGVLESADNNGRPLPVADDPDYGGDTPKPQTHAERELAVVDALQDAGWKIHSLTASTDADGTHTAVEAEYANPDAVGGGITWSISKQNDAGVTKGKAVEDVPENDAKTMAELIIMEANALVMQAELNDAQRLAALEAALPKGDIRSDDPDLIAKLQAKLAALTERSAFMRKANKLIRAGNDAGLKNMGISERQIATLKTKDFAGRIGFADYQLSNNNGVIAATRKRLEAAIKAARDMEAVKKEVDDFKKATGELAPGMVGEAAARERLTAAGYTITSTGPAEFREGGGGVLVRETYRLDHPGAGGKTLRVSNIVFPIAESSLARLESQAADAAAGRFAAGTEALVTGKTAEPFDHNGRRIYQGTVRGEAVWLVQTKENKDRVARGERPLGGDMIAKTREEAIQRANEMDANDERDAKWKADVEAQQKADAASLAERQDIDGFGDNLSALARGAAVEALNKLQRFNGQDMSRKAFVRQAVAAGATVTPHPQDGRRLNFDGGGYMTQGDIGKTAMDYAEYLIGKRGGGQAPEPKPEPKPEPAPADPQRAADLTVLQQIAAGTHPDMLAPETADLIEAALTRFPDDPEIAALADKAATAYSDGLTAIAAGR